MSAKHAHESNSFALALACALALVCACLVARPARAELPGPLFGQSPRPGPIELSFRTFAPGASRLVSKDLDTGFAYVDSLLRAAHDTHDVTLDAAARFFRGRERIRNRELARGLPDLDSVLVVARRMRDTCLIARVYASRGHGYQITGQQEKSKREFRQALPYCRASQFYALEGFVHRGLGGMAKMEGRYDEAQREFTVAMRQVRSDSQEFLNSRLQRAEVWNRQGRHDEAQAEFEAILLEARRRNDRFDTAAALHDLGNVAYDQQDMAAADRNWAYAATVYDSLDDVTAVTGVLTNRAEALIHQDRREEALALLANLDERNRRHPDPTVQMWVVGLRGQLLYRMGRLEEAERSIRVARAAALGKDENTYDFTTVELAGVLRESGRAAQAEDVLDSLLAPSRGVDIAVDNRAYAWMERSRARGALGRPNEALAAARQAERLAITGRTNGSYFWLDAATELARCQRAVGRPDSAVATLVRATRAWEHLRATISNLDWRERYGSGLSSLFAEYGLALLDVRRAAPKARREREAFDALQAFQARTLEERMHGEGLSVRAMTRRASADSLCRRVLRPGELLVDLVATPETTIVFALSTRGIESHLLPGTKHLDALFADWRGAMLGGAQPAVVEDGLRRLSNELLVPLAPALAASRRVIVSGGGPLMLWPIASLTAPGESAPLGETREVVSTPSATLFAVLRARQTPATAAPRLLALGRTTTASGRELPGAERELNELSADYAGVTVRQHKGDRTVSQLTSDLGRWDALHFAAHSEADASSPWRSGFLLGQGDNEKAYFRASAVARMRLHARVAVLSGCQSAGATTLAGEGALGLSSGFLCAGTTSVVATLWPIEDRTAERFMDAFYRALAGGRTIAAAAREARHELRARPETANPRDWAAFVVIGEPGTTLGLKRKGLFGLRSSLIFEVP